MLDWLSRIAPLGELEGLLNPPESLYQHENAFSSDEKHSASSLGGFFFSGQSLPGNMPEYSVAILTKASTQYFVFVDKKRKILINAPIRASEGHWENAIVCIRSAIRAKTGKKFAVSGEDGVSGI